MYMYMYMITHCCGTSNFFKQDVKCEEFGRHVKGWVIQLI